MVAASDVPLWAALLVGLGGGLLAALVTIANDRGAEMRTRKLTAADEFLIASLHVSRLARELRDALRRAARHRTEGAVSEVEEADGRFVDAYYRLDAVFVRLQLLYGEGSATFANAQRLNTPFVTLTAKTLIPWRRRQSSPPDPADLKAVAATLGDVDRGLVPARRAFAAAARRDVRYGAAVRLVGRVARIRSAVGAVRRRR